MSGLLLLAAALAAPAPQGGAELGKETTIPFASNGGIRNWQAGPGDSPTVYVQDRRQQWYQITLSGACLNEHRFEALRYTTDPSGTFDKFSEVWSSRYPTQRCGVESVRTSAPPQGQPGAPRPSRR